MPSEIKSSTSRPFLTKTAVALPYCGPCAKLPPSLLGVGQQFGSLENPSTFCNPPPASRPCRCYSPISKTHQDNTEQRIESANPPACSLQRWLSQPAKAGPWSPLAHTATQKASIPRVWRYGEKDIRAWGMAVELVMGISGS